jgi:hypothetical protein
MKNTKEQFKQWAIDCMGYSNEDVNECIDDNNYQIIDFIPNDEGTLEELSLFLN